MNLFQFRQEFSDEAACCQKFKEERDKIGIASKRCNCKDYYWLENKSGYECKKCHSCTFLWSGTVMENSRLPYRYWLTTIHLLTSTKEPFSTEELCCQLGHKRYQSIWKMVCKLREVMGKRDDKYMLTGQIELEEVEKVFPRVHTAICNVKRLFTGRAPQQTQTRILNITSMNSVINSTGDSPRRNFSTGLSQPPCPTDPISNPKFIIGRIADNH